MRAISVYLVMFLSAVLIIGLPCLSLAAEVYGCASKSTGALRIVSGLSQCKTSETTIAWNSAGPQGPPGDQGPVGPQGPAGPSVAFSHYLKGFVSGLPADQEFDFQVDCDAPDLPVSCGFDIGNGPNETKDVAVWTITPNGNGCQCKGKVMSLTESSSIHCYVSCLHVE